MENKKTGTAKIDINEYDRLMSIERDLTERNNELVMFLSAFLICLGNNYRKESLDIVNQTMDNINYQAEIQTSSGPMRIGSKGKLLNLKKI